MSFKLATDPSSLEITDCVITGAAGFLGSHLCRRLMSAGVVVHALTRTRPPQGLASHWHQCDVTDLAQVRAALAKARAPVVFHLAALVAGARDVELVMPTLHANLTGTVHVLLAAAEMHCARVVCLGSLQEPDQQGLASPPSPYGAAKFAASAYCRLFAEVYSLPVSIGRPFMAYGPGQMDLTKLVPHVITKLLRDEDAALSSGRQAFDWVYVDDVIDALLAIAVRPALAGMTIDIGCGELTSVRDVATGIAQRLDKAEALRLGALPDRRLEPTRHADVETTARLTGWRARTPLDEGLDRTVAWFRAHLQRA